MRLVAWMPTGLLMGSAWLLPPDRAEWLHGLVAEALVAELTESRAGRDSVAWLLGLILTSQRVRLTRSVLPITIGTATLSGVALYARVSFHLRSGVREKLDVQHSALGWWGFLALGLPLVTGIAVSSAAHESDLPTSTGATRGHWRLVVPWTVGALGSTWR